tara:strand:+ start:725 stop:916 length:192 start_codon:yes stop_codon:yes gene_type:complete
MTVRKVIHEYNQNTRQAFVLDTPSGFEVDLYENNNFTETRKVHEYNELYAENVAENWVLEVIK